jgi:hypothetical protein
LLIHSIIHFEINNAVAITPELLVKDIEKSQAIYRDKLRFQIAWTDASKTMGAVSKDEAVIIFAGAGRRFPNTLWFFADHVDETYKKFMKGSITISEDIETKPWGIRQFTIEDPDGNSFIFHLDI